MVLNKKKQKVNIFVFDEKRNSYLINILDIDFRTYYYLFFLGVPYIVTVYTNDKQNFNKDARVYLVMYGEGSARSQIFLSEGKFEKDAMDKFSVDLPEDLCPLVALDVICDNSGIKSAWCVDRVC